MKYKIIVFSILILFNFVFAHVEDAELNAEIQKGKELVEKFYRGEIKCQDLTDENFHSIGEYVMEQMIGGSDHLAMNKMMEQMHGEEGEKLMHINMGKRYLGCDGNANYQRGFLMMPMHNYNYWWQYFNFTTLLLIVILILLIYLILRK